MSKTWPTSCAFLRRTSTTVRTTALCSPDQRSVTRIEIAGKQLVLGIRGDRNLVLFRGPGAEVDQFAAIGAERTEFVRRGEFDGGAAGWAFNGWNLAHAWPPDKVR